MSFSYQKKVHEVSTINCSTTKFSQQYYPTLFLVHDWIWFWSLINFFLIRNPNPHYVLEGLYLPQFWIIMMIYLVKISPYNLNGLGNSLNHLYVWCYSSWVYYYLCIINVRFECIDLDLVGGLYDYSPLGTTDSNIQWHTWNDCKKTELLCHGFPPYACGLESRNIYNNIGVNDNFKDLPNWNFIHIGYLNEYIIVEAEL